MLPLWLSARRGRLLRTQHAIVVLCVLIIAAHGATTGYWLRHSYLQTVDDRIRLDGIAHMAAIDTGNALSEICAMLDEVASVAGNDQSSRTIDTPAIAAMLHRFERRKLQVSEILIFDDRGRVMYRAGRGAITAGNSSGEMLFAARRLQLLAGFFIGVAAPSYRTGDPSIMISRPLNRDGIRPRVIAAEVPWRAFGDLYGAIAPAGDIDISLLRNDDVSIVGVPKETALDGRVPYPTAASSRSLDKDRSHVLNTPSGGQSGKLRVFRSVPGYPLVVSVSRTSLKVPGGWYRQCAISLIGFLLIATIVTALAAIALSSLGRLQLAMARRRRSEARLQRQAALLQKTLENIGEGLSVFDRHGRLAAHNQRFHSLLDLPAGLPVGTKLADILLQQATRGDFGDLEPTAETARRIEQFYREVPITKERVTPAGRTLQIRRRAMPDGAVLSMYSDITELKESALAILRARSLAESANRSKSEFLANMSHELRTPLNAIIGFSEIISSELFGPLYNQKYLEYMRDILESSLHLLSIIDDVLDLSKIEAGKLELAKRAVTVQTIVADSLRMMRERAQLRGISLVPCVASDDIVIWADERALTQILLNLLSNAIKFSDKGSSVKISLSSVPTGGAAIEVEDCGIGMSDEEQKRALQPFGQAKPATTRDYGGTGLGLPITKGLVEAHGGTLTIKSAVGSGTLVRIVLPAQRSHAGTAIEGLA